MILVAQFAALSLSSSCTSMLLRPSLKPRCEVSATRSAVPTSIDHHARIPSALWRHGLPRRLPSVPGGADGRQTAFAYAGWLLRGVAHLPSLLSGHPFARLSLRALAHMRGVRAGGDASISRCWQPRLSCSQHKPFTVQTWVKARTTQSRPSSLLSPSPLGCLFFCSRDQPAAAGFASAHVRTAAIPYRLFALSNTGSLLALIAYPIAGRAESDAQVAANSLVRWLRRLRGTVHTARAADTTERTALTCRGTIAGAASDPAQRKWLWFLLPMAAAMQLSAVTGHLTVNIAAIPLLWMLPLAVYLLSFILAFEFPCAVSSRPCRAATGCHAGQPGLRHLEDRRHPAHRRRDSLLPR